MKEEKNINAQDTQQTRPLGFYVGQARNKHAVPAYFMEPKSKFQLAMDASDPHGATPAQI